MKGPELVTVREFNRRNRSDGIGFEQTQTFLQRVFGQVRTLRLPRAIEPSHILNHGRYRDRQEHPHPKNFVAD